MGGRTHGRSNGRIAGAKVHERWLLGLIAFIASVYGYTTDAAGAEIRGFVRENPGEGPIAYVDVVARDVRDSTFVRGISSSADGSYRILDVPPGRYVVRAFHIGYVAWAETLSVEEPWTELQVRLMENPIPIAGVSVFGDRFKGEREVQPGFQQMTRERLKRIPGVVESDPIRSLQLLPGVQAASDISSGLYIRGGGPDQTVVLLDQVPIFNPTHAFGFFSTFNPDAVEEIALYKGAYPAPYGGRLGSVIDVRSRQSRPDSLDGAAAIGLISSRVYLEAPIGSRSRSGTNGSENDPRGHWMVSARRTLLEPLLNAVRTPENEIPDYYFYDLNGRLELRGMGSSRWIVGGYTGNDNLRLDLDKDSYIDLGWGNTAGWLSTSGILGTRFLGSAQASYSEYESDNRVQIFSTPIEFSNRIREVALRGDLTWEASAMRTYRSGMVGTLYEVSLDQEFNRDPLFSYSRKPEVLSGYLQEDAKRGGLHTIAGVHASYVRPGDHFFVEPRLSFSHALGAHARLKAGGGLYHQYMQLTTTEGFSAGDFYVPIDETAEPGRAIQGVVGIEVDPSERYRFTGEVYYTDLANLVELDNRVTGDQEGQSTDDLFVTGGTGWASGIELMAERRVGPWTGWVGYTLGWTRRTFAELNGGKAFPPKYDRRNDLKATLSVDRGPWSYGSTFVLGTGQAFTPATGLYTIRNPGEDGETIDVLVYPGRKNSARLLPYHRLDVSVTREWTLAGHPARWMFQVFNLYSRRNEWFIQYDTKDLAIEPAIVRMLPVIPSFGVEVEF